MTQGTILNAAKQDNNSFFSVFLVLSVLCGGVVALNWTYVYNFATGPHRLTKSIASAPGMREFVRAEGPMLETGAEATSKTHFAGLGTLGRLAAAAGNAAAKEHVSARFTLMMVDGVLLVAMVPPDFKGDVVEGRLTPMPAELKAPFGSDTAVYPYMLDATSSYRWSFNLFILVAAPAFPLMILGLVSAARKKGDVTRHRALAKLARHGQPLALIPRIEREMADAGEHAHIGRFWITSNWIVMLSPTLDIFSMKDLAAIGHEATQKKEGDKVVTSHLLYLFTRGAMIPDMIDVKEDEALAILDALRAQHPWVLVDSVATFKKRWNKEKDACAKEADAKRKAALTAATSGANAVSPGTATPARSSKQIPA